MSLPATDSFNRTASTLGSNWTAVFGAITDWTLVSGVGAVCGFGGADYAIDYWNADSFNDDQYAQVVLTKGTTGYQGVVVRASSSGASRNAYAVTLESGYNIYKWVSGTRTSLKSGSHAWTAGHTLKLEVIGTTLTVYDNGTSFDSTTDSSLASGSPGVIGYSDPLQHFTNFQADNTSAPPAGQPTMRRWGGVPYLGGQGIGNKGPGRAWGRSRIVVPEWRFA